MSFKHVASNALHCLRIGVTTLALFQFTIGGPLASSIQAATPDNDNNTTSPIKHIIVIIGENRSFDHVFATYKPAPGQTVNNLLSEKIINADGTPVPISIKPIKEPRSISASPSTVILSY
jgi:phospholipase C